MLQKLLSFSFLFLSVFAFNQHKTSYVEGEVLFQLDPKKEITTFENSLKHQFFIQNSRTELLSKNVNIYRLQFDPTVHTHEEILDILNDSKDVIAAQNNHYVSNRATIPNDTEFSSQWHHQNTGQTGGNPGSDISTTDAWDITTGGLTFHGDSIVVCVIEEQGGLLTLPDLAPNAWKNHNEIPNNGIDDDNNGYIDDYLGWNIQDQNDDIGMGSHGTQVSSMIGAKGNDNQGGTGINWDVKIMMIKGVVPASEASVLMAYDYPLTMRKLYNQSNGSEGAFVVVTNASWGVDNADPSSFPLWCNFYDSLGTHGILNIGATANNNVDIDIAGDMPTACGSDYLISVTATDHNDVRNFSGYGATTIDLAAPGQNTHLLYNSGNYGNSTGTSFACPAVAGAVALMYSVDCPSFMSQVKTNPSAATLLIRQTLLDGVDPVANLVGETVTGGRLNVFNALNELIGQCDTNECSFAYSISTDSITDTTVRIDWSGISNSYWFYIKDEASSSFDSVLVDTNFVFIDSLTFCNGYNFYLVTDCDSTFSNPSPIYSFDTEGCCEPPMLEIDTISATEISLFWNPVFSANDYDIRIRELGTSTWIPELGIQDTFLILNNLDSCTQYEIQIRTNCSQINIGYSSSTLFSSKGCGACYDQSYCEVQAGNSNLEWIERIVLNDLDYTSGNNNGYLFADTVTTALLQGENYTLSIVPGYSGFNFTDHFYAWIDFDQNGIFDASEVILQGYENGMISDPFTVPLNAVSGQTRMRLIQHGQGSASNPCISSVVDGEIEEYCIWIGDYASIDKNDKKIQYTVYPNPTRGKITVILPNSLNNIQIEIFDNYGKKVVDKSSSNHFLEYNMEGLESGLYILQIRNSNQIIGREKIVKSN